MIIVIEGGDQAGKLTQSILLEKALKKRKIKTKKKGSISRGDSSRSMMSKSVVDSCSAADDDSDESDYEKYAANIPPKKSQFFKANELSEENSNSSEDDET